MKAVEAVEREKAAYAEVDGALRTCPLAPVPPRFSAAVMARVRATASLPPFRPAWIDYAVSLLGAAMVGAGLTLWQALPPHFAASTRLQFTFLFQFPGLTMAWAALAGGLALSLVALLAATAIFARSSTVRHK